MIHNEYTVKNISCSDFNIKKIEIYGNYIFEKNEIIKKIKNVVKEFLDSNKDVDYLIAYYYPTYEDMNNNLALCSLILNRDKKNVDLTYENVYQKIIWNEYYEFFSASKKAIKIFYANVFNEADKMLQLAEDAYFILYRLSMMLNYEKLSELNDVQEDLEIWLIRAEHMNKFFCKLKPVVNYDFISLIRYMNDILYHFYISHCSGIRYVEDDRKLLINKEIKNALNKVKIIRQQLTDFIEKYSNKEIGEDNFQFFLGNKIIKKGGKKI